jgi:nicotinate-nucleotide adenylyltransferase
LAYLREKYPANEFAVIMGSDSLQNLPKWKNYQWLLRNYAIYVYLRPEHETVPVYPEAMSIQVVEAPLLPISSTTIRQHIRQGKSIRYLVPDAVREEIEKSGYYLH